MSLKFWYRITKIKSFIEKNCDIVQKLYDTEKTLRYR